MILMYFRRQYLPPHGVIEIMLDLRHIEFLPAPAALGVNLRGDEAGARVSPMESGPLEGCIHPLSESQSLVKEIIAYGGIDPAAYRAAALERRVPALLRLLRVSTPGAARGVLRRSPDLRSSALSTLLIGVTDFFRDPEVFEYLYRKELPALLAARANPRILSVGSSDGHEPYSMAMLLAETGALSRCELVGIDCRSDAVVRARAARFRPEAMAPLSPERATRHFFTCGNQGSLRSDITGAVRFQVADLFTYSGAGPWDMILCRNVVMYFERSAAERAWRHLASQLSPGGLLITGKAEQPNAGLDFVRLAPCVYRKFPLEEPARGGFQS